jgi:hypothetical protein
LESILDTRLRPQDFGFALTESSTGGFLMDSTGADSRTSTFQNLIRLKEQGLGRVIRIGDSAQASDIKQLNDSGIAISGVEKDPGTNKDNWDQWRAGLLEGQGAFKRARASQNYLSPLISQT